MKRIGGWAAVALLGLAACGEAGEEVQRAAVEPARRAAEEARAAVVATVYGDPRERVSSTDLERGRMDPAWRRYVQVDTASDTTGAAATAKERWEDIAAPALNSGSMQLPLSGDVSGPSVARLQIALDRARFSPGIIDGRWGKNTEKAVYWIQKREGIPATGRVDRRTWDRLLQLAGSPRQFAVAHRLSPEDVAGPFVKIPDDIYAKAKLQCMCYESLSEKLAEMFHTSPELLLRLNPGVDLNALRAGQTIQVPDVRDTGTAPDVKIARLVISDGGHYLHAVAADGRIVHHFPTTLGSDYAPSPTGEFRITNIAEDPEWHYQPDLLTGVPDHEEDAMIPAGPNNAVGVVWMQLSKPHYGIHGTSAPETIGYTTSHGCVRLTNWDASFLADRIEPGVTVQFRDVDNSGARATDE